MDKSRVRPYSAVTFRLAVTWLLMTMTAKLGSVVVIEMEISRPSPKPPVTRFLEATAKLGLLIVMTFVLAPKKKSMTSMPSIEGVGRTTARKVVALSRGLIARSGIQKPVPRFLVATTGLAGPS